MHKAKYDKENRSINENKRIKETKFQLSENLVLQIEPSDLSRYVSHYQQLAVRIDKHQALLGTCQDTIQLRTDMFQDVETSRKLSSAIRHCTNSILSNKSKSMDALQVKMQCKKINRDLSKFEIVVQHAIDKEAVTQPRKDVIVDVDYLRKSSNILFVDITKDEIEKSYQCKQEYHEDIETRQEEIQNLLGSIKNVHKVFGDLSQIVSSQQDQFDALEASVDEAKSNATKGYLQIQKASNKQYSSGRFLEFFLVVLIILLGVVVVVILTTK